MKPIDEALDAFLVHTMMLNYGDLLKVSRTRGVLMTLPELRAYLKDNPWMQKKYKEALKAEQEGQGLLRNATLNGLIEAQAASFRDGDTKNTKLYADEIKKIISVGIEGDVKEAIAEATNSKKASRDMVSAILKNPWDVDIDAITDADALAVRTKFLNPNDGFKVFAKWAFHIQTGSVFQTQDFHDIIFDFCQQAINGQIDRGIITIPPRHSKTQIVSILLPLYSYVKNPASQNIITSYAEDVVGESSGYVRQIMTSEIFGRIFPEVRIDPSKRSLERWGTTRGGVFHAVPTGGRMTGKGAGSLSPVYSGLFCVDDVIKPKDAYSAPVRIDINDRFDNTFMSRLANGGYYKDADGVEHSCPRTPLLIIMQRVHDDDLVGFLLRGGSSDKYTYLNIPALIEEDTGSAEYYKRLCDKQLYTHAVPYLYDLKRKEKLSALWPSRKSLQDLLAMQKATPYTFNSQYMGDPTAKGTGLIQDGWWQEWTEIPKADIIRTFMTADTAVTAKTHSDYSVFTFWGVTKSLDLYMLDVELGKWEIPELKLACKAFWKKHNNLDLQYPCMLPQAMFIEDKMSGTFLNQTMTREADIRVLPVPRDKTGGDKIARFLNAVPYFAQGRMYMIPSTHTHSAHVKREIMGMRGHGSGTGHDDVADNVSDGCAIAFGEASANYGAWV